MSAAPRSVDNTRISTCAAASAVVTTTFLNSVDFIRLDATKNTNRIFTNSEGWIPIPAISNPSFAPPDVAAKTATSVKAPSPTPA